MRANWMDRLIPRKCTPPPKHNKYLLQAYRFLERGGWSPTSRGGPDFFAFKKGKDGRLCFCAVLVMRRRTYKLRRHQLAIAETLARYSVPVFRFDCDSGEWSAINFLGPAGVVPASWEETWRREQAER